MYALGRLYYRQGRHKEAKSLAMQEWKLSENVLGESDAETLYSMHFVAETLYHTGNREEALSMMEDCLRLQRQTLGPDHEDSLESMRYVEKRQNKKRGGGLLKRSPGTDNYVDEEQGDGQMGSSGRRSEEERGLEDRGTTTTTPLQKLKAGVKE
ncbi:hypothetical protein B0H66DRAFT_530585 [Apodospora peruviana]|uniref:Kinesin light chain n=1 Tax=Apodospora peruviana TaxID=516989 RepID=A0AAE0ILK9_9PEZI|nr:hypothetical protein B0H66DRAFT_530585 [Apodospora peruviana]